MPFPFLGLPAELRTKVYRFLLHYGELVVDPIDGVCSAIASPERKIFDLADSIPFLRTCAQIHEEATFMLYGSNQFYFGDESHGCVLVPKCGCLQVTEIAYLHIWLQLIGKNRTKIRQLCLEINSPTYLYYPGEIGLKLYNLDKEDQGKGSYLGRAFAILSHGHNLQKLEMSFRPMGVELADHLLGFGWNSMLIQQMAKVSGIKEFLIEPLPETRVGLETWAALKAMMEGKGRNAKVDSSKGSGTDATANTDSTDLSAVLHKLCRSVDELNDGVKKITSLVAEVEGRVTT